MSTRLVSTLVISFITISSAYGFNMSIDRSQMRTRDKIEVRDTVRISGRVQLHDGVLQIQENSSGKTYLIAGDATQDTIQIYRQGVDQVTVEGTLSNDTTINAKTVTRL